MVNTKLPFLSLKDYTPLLYHTGKLYLIKEFVKLTTRLHVAVHLFSNRSQMMSKCSKNKKGAHQA